MSRMSFHWDTASRTRSSLCGSFYMTLEPPNMTSLQPSLSVALRAPSLPRSVFEHGCALGVGRTSVVRPRRHTVGNHPLSDRAAPRGRPNLTGQDWSAHTAGDCCGRLRDVPGHVCLHGRHRGEIEGIESSCPRRFRRPQSLVPMERAQVSIGSCPAHGADGTYRIMHRCSPMSRPTGCCRRTGASVAALPLAPAAERQHR